MTREDERIYKPLLYLMILHFIIGILFDFSGTIFSYYIRTPLEYPAIGDISIGLWLLFTAIIFMKILKLVGYDKLNLGLLLLFFLFYMVLGFMM